MSKGTQILPYTDSFILKNSMSFQPLSSYFYKENQFDYLSFSKKTSNCNWCNCTLYIYLHFAFNKCPNEVLVDSIKN